MLQQWAKSNKEVTPVNVGRDACNRIALILELVVTERSRSEASDRVLWDAEIIVPHQDRSLDQLGSLDTFCRSASDVNTISAQALG